MAKMKEAGYGDPKKQKMSLKESFARAIQLAEEETGVKQTAKGWQKNTHV